MIGIARRVVAGLIVGSVRVYQWTLSPLLGPACRFEPTCSQYMILAVRKYGPVRGFARGVGRVARCHPWSEGGPDPP